MERATKTWARYWLADRRHWAQVSEQFTARYTKPFRCDRSNLFTGNAATQSVWQALGRNIDYIYSHDVFEHIPADELPAVITNMAQALGSGGLAIIEPHIFTGIAGGHDLEWRDDQVDEKLQRRRVPWERLRQDRFPADTFLNRLRRVEYRALFNQAFEIVEEIDLTPDLGRQHLTPSIHQELVAYSEEDLFSNRIRFVLKKRCEQQA